MKKRYSIVRVDNKCALDTEDDFYCSAYMQKDKCKKCKEIRGDTKEQLIRKVAQASINYYENRPFSKVNFQDMARWIVEFLGVEE